MKDYKFHPLAELFPLMPEPELKEMASDIKDNGQRQDIILHDGMILDGRNRYLACKIAGVEGRFKEHKNAKDAAKLVWSLNGPRRHLNESQRALVAAEFLKMSQATDTPMTAEDAAKAFNTSGPTLKRASKVAKKGSKKIKEAVMNGKLSVSRASKIVALPKGKQAKAAKEQKKAPRGGLAASAMESKETPKRKDVLEAFDDCWNENRTHWESFPQAKPAVVIKALRKAITDAVLG